MFVGKGYFLRLGGFLVNVWFKTSPIRFNQFFMTFIFLSHNTHDITLYAILRRLINTDCGVPLLAWILVYSGHQSLDLASGSYKSFFLLFFFLQMCLCLPLQFTVSILPWTCTVRLKHCEVDSFFLCTASFPSLIPSC